MAAIATLRRLRLPAISPSVKYPHTLHFRLNILNLRPFTWGPWARSPVAASDDKLATGIDLENTYGSVKDSNTGVSSSLSSDFRLEKSPSLSLGWESGLGVGSVTDLVESSWWDYPTGVMISVLDGFHDLTGLPWWAVITSSAVALRLSMFPVLCLQLKKMGKFAELIPKLPPPLPHPQSGRSYREQYLLFQEKRRELGCPSYLWSFVSFSIQFPLFLLLITSIRRMCLDHHPGFECGGILWLQNLTDYPQGTLAPVFPILIAGLHYANIQISFKTFKFESLQGILGLLAKYYKIYLDILALPLLFIGFHIPQGSLVYWATNSSLTLIQQICLKNQNIRKRLGLPAEIVQQRKNPVSMESSPHEKSSSLEIVISVDNLGPGKLLEIALEELGRGHQDTALPLLRIATNKDPELVKGLVAMGQILFSKKEFVEATACFERALSKIQSEDVGLLVLSYFGAGLSHIWQGNKSEGIEHLKRIAQLKEPNDPIDRASYSKGLVTLASYLSQEGKNREAAKYLTIAAAYDPGVNEYLKQLEEDDEQQENQPVTK